MVNSLGADHSTIHPPLPSKAGWLSLTQYSEDELEAVKTLGQCKKKTHFLPSKSRHCLSGHTSSRFANRKAKEPRTPERLLILDVVAQSRALLKEEQVSKPVSVCLRCTIFVCQFLRKSQKYRSDNLLWVERFGQESNTSCGPSPDF